MNNITKEIISLCRFCLCQDKEKILTIANALNATLTIEDVQRFSGIPILRAETVSHSICFTCLDSVKKSTDFRDACIRNDATFRQLFFELTTTTKEEPGLVWQETTPQEQDPLEFKCDIIELVKAERIDYMNEESLLNQVSDDTVASQEFPDENYKAPYSANYIELGEPMSDTDDDECPKRKAPKKSRMKPTYVRSVVPVLLTNRIKPEPKDTESDIKNPSKPHKRQPYKRAKVLCELCGKEVVNFVGHILTHKEATFKCPHCPVKMTNSANFNHHVRAVHEKRIIRTCELCGEGFTHVASHVSHMRSKHGIGKIHECSICSKKFLHPSGLNCHIRKEHRHDTHKCEFCGNNFRSREILRRHMRSHSDDTPYGCRHCTKQFKSSYARNIHELTHAGVTFPCSHCKASYRYKAQLMMHLRKTHPDSEEINKPSDQASSEEVDRKEDTKV